MWYYRKEVRELGNSFIDEIQWWAVMNPWVRRSWGSRICCLGRTFSRATGNMGGALSSRVAVFRVVASRTFNHSSRQIKVIYTRHSSLTRIPYREAFSLKSLSKWNDRRYSPPISTPSPLTSRKESADGEASEVPTAERLALTQDVRGPPNRR
jgi:hypothetical protein